MRIKNKIPILILALSLAGCQTPSLKYATKDVEASAHKFGLDAQKNLNNSSLNTLWWQEGLSSQDRENLSILLAQYDTTETAAQVNLKIEQAVENKKITSSGFSPKADLQIGANKSKATESGSLGINFSYNPGLLGVKEFSEMLSDFEIYSSKITKADSYLSWQNQVYTTYFQLKSIQGRIFFLEKNSVSLKENIDMLKQRVAAGFSTQADLEKQISTYIDSSALINNATSAKIKYTQALLTLIGRSSENATKLEGIVKNFDYSAPVDLNFKDYSLNKDILLQRMDVQQSQIALFQSAAKKEAAGVAQYPQLSLTSSIGFSSSGGTFNLNNFGWNLAAMLITPILDGGKLNAQQQYYSLEYKLALSKYTQTLDKAIQDVTVQMDNLVQSLNQYQNLVAYKQAISAQKNQIIHKFEQGMQSKITTNDNLRVLSQYDLNLIDYQYAVYLNWAGLNAATGYSKTMENNNNEK